MNSTERLEKALRGWLSRHGSSHYASNVSLTKTIHFRTVRDSQLSELAAHLTAAGLVWRDDNMDDFLHAVATEVERAEVKWPDNNVLHRLAALSGEVGELAQGYLKDESVEALTIEAIQVAAMAYRITRALAQPTDGGNDGPKCHDCGLSYDDPGFADLVVEQDTWNNILSPTNDEGGLLCPTCLVRAAAKAHIMAVATLRSGPFSALAQPTDGGPDEST